MQAVGIHAHPTKKLGRRPIPPHVLATMPRLSDHMDLSALPAPPDVVDWTKGVDSWGLDHNDEIGDCAIVATLDNLWRGLLAASGTKWQADPEVIVGAYSVITGYDPDQPETDQGTVETDALSYAIETGFDGYHLNGYALVNPRSSLHMRQAAWMFGGLLLGCDLPISAQSDDDWNDHGTGADNLPGSWGGHEVYSPKADANGLWVVTWGGLKHATWQWVRRYCSDAKIVTAGDWFAPDGRAPNGWDAASLNAASLVVGK